MTLPSPSTEGSSLPPRHRPSVEALVKNSTEHDLWNLDDFSLEGPESGMGAPAPPAHNLPIPAPPAAAAVVPQQDSGKIANPHRLAVPVIPRHKGSQSPHVERLARTKAPLSEARVGEANLPPVPVPNPGKLEDTFDNLADWDVAGSMRSEAADLPPPVPPAEAAEASAPALALRQHEPPAPVVAADSTPATAIAEPDEFTPVSNPNAKPISLRLKLRLSLIELISLIILTLMLVAGGSWIYQNSISRLHRQSGQIHKIVYPVKGSHVTVVKAASYWRAPLKQGDHPETVRRGVVIIPVVELTLRGGPGAIRAQVYNEANARVGDPFTHQVNGETMLVIAATDGFDDMSQHASYRAGQTKSWTLRLFEAPAVNSILDDFKPLLEMPISPEKR